jgi:hypothetical protein
MEDTLEAAYCSAHREHRLNQHALVRCTSATQLEVDRDALATVEADVSQDNRLLVLCINHWQEDLIGCVGRVPIPGRHFAMIIDQPAQLQTHNPTQVRLSFLPYLTGAAALTDRVDQFDTTIIDDHEEGWVGQEAFAPGMVRRQRALQTSAIGQPLEQRVIVPLQPVVEGTELATLQAKQQPDGYQFARPQLGLGVLRVVAHPVSYLTEQSYDVIPGGHGVLLRLSVSHLTAWENPVLMSN